MAWLYLFIAGLLEIIWAFAMKQSDGFTKPVPTAVTLVALLASLAFLALAMRSLPLGTAYAVWTGIGAIGAFAVGIIFLSEPINALRAGAAVMILGGLVLMKAS